MIGRPYVYGLAAGGEADVGSVIGPMRAELDAALALLGRPRLADLAGCTPLAEEPVVETLD